MFADLYVSYPLDSSFTYRVPPGLTVVPGVRVKINFAGRVITGFVVGILDEEPRDFEIKDVLEVIDGEAIFDRRLVDLADYIASSYLSSTGEVLSMAIPSGTRPSSRYRIPFERRPSGSRSVLTGEQGKVYDDILTGSENGERAHLVHGITGSGKTEIYIELAGEIIRRGGSVIYLVPEISLSSQIFERLFNVFGNDLIIYHSHLTPGQRLYNWKRFYSGDAKIAVGTRSAVFLPCPALGLIIIDEEHDGSYKEHSTPRYNARRVAFYRGKTEGSLTVMGSATPSIESLYAAETGVMRLHRLIKRYGNSKLPSIEIVKIGSGKSSEMLSPILKLMTKKTIDSGSQVILLLNRRGFAPLMLCDTCGHVVECPHCNISMNCHNDGMMLCHYCGYRKKVPENCGHCGSEKMTKVGSGTQRVEENIIDIFKGVRVFRLDQDSSRKKGAVLGLIEKMNNGEIDILLGTQMVAKGFDFPGVTLVGVLLADIGINLPDFRAAERIFSLLVQVAGRSGRGDNPGKVIIQTINDGHELFKYIRNQDYYGFYRYELSVRKTLDYPPFSRMARLLVRGRDEKRVVESIEILRSEIAAQCGKLGDSIAVLGPSPAPFEKIGGNYRYHIILKSKNVNDMRKVIGCARGSVTGRDVYLEIDIDPYDIL